MRRFLIILPFLFFSCETTHSKKEFTTKNEVLDKTNATKKLPSYSDLIETDFVEFLNKFSSDSLFQMQHIKFPLDFDGGVIAGERYTEGIDSLDWMLVNLTDTSDFMKALDLVEEQEISLESATLKVTNTQKQIHYEYRFVRENNDWYLKKYIDFSGWII